MAALQELLAALRSGCGWEPHRIHLLGFSQVGEGEREGGGVGKTSRGQCSSMYEWRVMSYHQQVHAPMRVDAARSPLLLPLHACVFFCRAAPWHWSWHGSSRRQVSRLAAAWPCQRPSWQSSWPSRSRSCLPKGEGSSTLRQSSSLAVLLTRVSRRAHVGPELDWFNPDSERRRRLWPPILTKGTIDVQW